VELEEVLLSSGQVNLEEVFVSWASIFFRSDSTWLFKAPYVNLCTASFISKISYVSQTECGYVFNGSHNKQELFSNTELSDFFITETECFLRGTNWGLKYNSGYI
jgi:hypothetical protein